MHLKQPYHLGTPYQSDEGAGALEVAVARRTFLFFIRIYDTFFFSNNAKELIAPKSCGGLWLFKMADEL